MTTRKKSSAIAPGKTIGVKKPSAERWASDVIVDMLHRYQLPYAALNPGASYRGLHDSIVNYGQNYPVMMLCQHEETAVQIAHGYAKASGKPMVAIVHNLVGLLHSNMAVYYAYIDRAPIFIIGATGPMDETKRRPRIDWTHTANVQGQAVRDYTKWDYQPTVVDLHVLRRVATGGTVEARCAIAATRRDDGAVSLGTGSVGVGARGRDAIKSTAPGHPRGVCGTQCKRL
jgi:hypothetical protein